MNWLDDKHIFNWGRGEENDLSDDVFYFLDRVYTGISGRSRSGSVSESDSRNRSRANSISSEGFKVEGMTSTDDKGVTPRRIFRIDDVDEDDDEDEVQHLAVEAKKDV
jgi:glycerol-3-phosphate O-acyltransferase/dihydroxyacetone phosphate acyltransferase